MHKRFRFLVPFFFSLLPYMVMGQNPYFHHITKTDGLPDNTVYDVKQDRNGMMWIATNDGICSYDGFNFRTFYSESQSSRSGSNIVEDNYGRIWYCSFDGQIYYVEKGKLNWLKLQQPIGYHRFNILDNVLVYLEVNKLVFLDLKSIRKISEIPFDTSEVLGVYKKGNVIYICSDYLYEIHTPSKIIKHEFPKAVKESFKGCLITEKNNNLVLVSRLSGDYCIFTNGRFGVKKSGEGQDDFIQNISCTDSYDWYSTTKGIARIKSNGNFNQREKFFEEYNVSSVFRDVDSRYWISTLGSGLLFVPDFSNVLYATVAPPVVIGSMGSDVIYGTSNDKIIKVKSFTGIQKQEILFNGNSGHGIVNMLANNKSGQLYFTSNTFKIINENGGIVNEENLALKQLLQIDDCHYAYAASGNCGIIRVCEGESYWGKMFDEYRHKSLAPQHIISLISLVRGKSVAYDSIGKAIYFATNIGLLRFTEKGFKEIKSKKHSYNLSKIYFYGQSVFGLTADNKLLEVNMRNKKAKVLYGTSPEDDLLLKIKLVGNMLYMVTSCNVIAYDLNAGHKEKIFTIHSGLEINDLQVKENMLLLATSRGILKILAEVDEKKREPKFLLQNVVVNNVEVGLNELENLSNNQNNIELQFSVISYLQNSNDGIHYRINGGSWKKTVNNARNLQLTSLSSGDYVVEFKTLAAENMPTTIVKIKIEKSVWQSWWFIISVAFVLVYGISLFYRNRIRQIKRRNLEILEKVELESSLNQSKLKAIKSQMNPHFFYNALNTLQSYILSNEKREALDYLSKFSGLTRTILDMTEKDSVTIADEIKTLTLYLEIEKVRFNSDFEFEISVDKNIDAEHTEIPSMLLQPYVENAIKHGLLHKSGFKKVTVTFSRHAHCISIVIDDNGVGRKRSGELNKIKNKGHQSFATAAIKNRIDLLNENKNNKIAVAIIDKAADGGPYEGTIVKIEIPRN